MEAGIKILVNIAIRTVGKFLANMAVGNLGTWFSPWWCQPNLKYIKLSMCICVCIYMCVYLSVTAFLGHQTIESNELHSISSYAFCGGFEKNRIEKS